MGEGKGREGAGQGRSGLHPRVFGFTRSQLCVLQCIGCSFWAFVFRACQKLCKYACHFHLPIAVCRPCRTPCHTPCRAVHLALDKQCCPTPRCNPRLYALVAPSRRVSFVSCSCVAFLLTSRWLGVWRVQGGGVSTSSVRYPVAVAG